MPSGWSTERSIYFVLFSEVPSGSILTVSKAASSADASASSPNKTSQLQQPLPNRRATETRTSSNSFTCIHETSVTRIAPLASFTGAMPGVFPLRPSHTNANNSNVHSASNGATATDATLIALDAVATTVVTSASGNVDAAVVNVATSVSAATIVASALATATSSPATSANATAFGTTAAATTTLLSEQILTACHDRDLAANDQPMTTNDQPVLSAYLDRLNEWVSNLLCYLQM